MRVRTVTVTAHSRAVGRAGGGSKTCLWVIKLVLVGGIRLIFVVFSMYVCGGSDCVCDSLFRNAVYLVSLSLIMKIIIM